MEPLKPEEVFTPGSYPTHTYVNRGRVFEDKLRASLATKGFLTSIIGPSKSGKSVLVETVIGTTWVRISGSDLATPDAVWSKALAVLGEPSKISESTSSNSSIGGAVEAGGEAGIPLVAKGHAKASAKSETGRGRSKTKEYSVGMDGAIKTVLAAGKTLVIDDFHYVERKVQKAISRQLKEAVALGLPVVVLAVPHRGDDPIRANPDLRGRVQSLDIGYWSAEQLREIARQGFPKVGLKISDATIVGLAAESLGSPLLMQALCLEAARLALATKNTAAEITLDAADFKKIAHDTVSLTNARTAFKKLTAGPKRHGRVRTAFPMKGGETGDNYALVLRAVAADPPSTNFPYALIMSRIGELVEGKPPQGLQLVRALEQMQQIMSEGLQDDRVLEWDEDKETLDIVDPHFLFYLRWEAWQKN